MELLDKNERTLRRLRDLQPIPDWMIKTLSIIGQPIFWLAILIAALWQSSKFHLWNLSISMLLVLPVIGALYYLATILKRDIQPDLRPLPPEVEDDHELQRVVDRLTRQGGTVRMAQRQVIDAYVQTHHKA